MRDQFIQLIRLRNFDQHIFKRFLNKFTEKGSDECWLWVGVRNTVEDKLGAGHFGAGRFYLRRNPDVSISAARVQWERCVGPLDKYSRVTLDCGNKHCMNTLHMRVRGRGFNYTASEAAGLQWNP